MVPALMIAWNGCWSPNTGPGLGGRVVQRTGPVLTSSPWIWPAMSPTMTVRLVTRGLMATLWLVREGTLTVVFHKRPPSRVRAYTVPVSATAYTRSFTTTGLPTTGPSVG